MPARLLTSRPRVAAVCVVAGLLIAAALPPWGWWPAAFPGLVLLDLLIADRPAASRFRRGYAVAFTLLAPTLIWIGAFTPPGYVLAAIFYSGVMATGVALVPPSAPGRWLALPATWMLAEIVRSRWPFGGVPVSTLALGQVGGPLVTVARVGGAILLSLLTFVAALGIAAAIARRWSAAVIAAAAVLVALVGAAVAPRGHDVGALSVAIVQGGGPQGTSSAQTDDTLVFERHLQASTAIQTPVDLVLWPEDVVGAEGPVAQNPEGAQLSALARRLHTTLLVGVVEGDGDGFHNAQLAIDPGGRFIDRYEKVHRVPFGEYVPLRWLLEPLAGNGLITRDAIPGSGHGILDTPVGTFGVSISWEIFFPDRARDAIGNGGEVLLNPTNGASFTGTIVQTEQIAQSRLRAIETGRWTLQAAPTGFSAIITPDGEVTQRTGISEQRVLHGVVQRRQGQTIATRLGDWPAAVLAFAMILAGWYLERRGRAGSLNHAGGTG
jgi:apolipoprotein N-acyltransferase